MEPIVLDFTSISLKVKNKEKYFCAAKTHQKGKSDLKESLHEYTTL